MKVITEKRLREWKPVVGYEKYYEVSSSGEVRKISGEIVGQWLNNQGYSLVRLSNPRTMKRVHRLVAAAFISNDQNHTIINHIDHCRDNNHVSNLEWCTQKHNLNHAKESGRMPNDYWLGKRSPSASLSDESVTKIKLEYMEGGVSHNGLAVKYGVSKRTIGRIVNGETYV